jgi:hypothetical protein
MVAHFTLFGGPVSFAVENLGSPDLDPVVYISRDPQWGKLSLAIRNNSGDNVVHVDTGSLLTVRLDSLLTAAEIGAIPPQPETSGWEGGPVARDNAVLLELRPKRRIPIRPSDSITIEIDNVLASGAMTTGFFAFAWSGFQPVADGSQRVTMFRHRPPVPGQSPWPLAVSLAPRPEYGNVGDTVYVTPWTVTPKKPAIENDFVLQLTNQGSRLALPDEARPSLVISFITGEGESALCSDDQLKDVNAVVTQDDRTAQWNKPGKDTSGPAAIWTITPEPGSSYLFDEGGIVRLRFDTLRTQAEVDTGSPVFVQCGGLPHWNDCLLPVATLSKAAPVPYVRDFHATAAGKQIEPNGTVDFAPLELMWNVFAAETCWLKDAADPDNPASVGCVASTKIGARPDETYTLVPQIGAALFPGLPNSQVQFHVTPPKASLAASLTAIAPQTPVTLTWDCSNGASCTLFANDVPVADALPLSGSKTLPVPQTTTYRIECVGAGSTPATAVVEVPHVQAHISVQAGSVPPRRGSETWTWGVAVSWNTEYAVSCQVVCLQTGQAISNALQGSWQDSGWGQYPGYVYQVTAVGNGTSQAQGP